MGIEGTHGIVTLADYLRILRRRWWVIVLTTILVTAGAYFLSTRQETLYTASTKMLVSNQTLPSSLSGVSANKSVDPTRDLSTLAGVAEVPTVAERAVHGAPGTEVTPAQLLAETSVSADPNADLLTFNVTDARPDVAVLLANQYASQFIAYRTGLQNQVIDNALVTLSQRISKLRAALNGVKPADQDVTVRQQLGVLLSKQQDLQNLKALQGNNLVIVEKAEGAPKTQPKTTRDVLAGAGLGLLVGMLLAFVVNALDNRLRSAEEVSAELGMPLLARIPAPPRRLRKNDELSMLSDAPGEHGEAYRKLRTNLDFANIAVDARVVMITSAVEREGKSTTVCNLAVALARAGRRTIIVDLDLRRPYVHRLLKLPNAPGITDVAIGRVELDGAIHEIDLDSDMRVSESRNGGGAGRLEAVPAGSLPPDPAEFVGAEALTTLLDRLRERADIVLIDTPPLLPVSDAMTISSSVDGIIFVAKAGEVRRGMLAEAHRLLASLPATKLGFVLANAQADDRYGYGGNYGGYSPSHTEPSAAKKSAVR